MKAKSPEWKQAVLAGNRWPEALDVPQHARIARGSKPLISSVDANGAWAWQLSRGPKGRTYYLQVWPEDDPKAYQHGTPAAILTPGEALLFIMANWVPPLIVSDVERWAGLKLRSTLEGKISRKLA